MKNHLGLYDLQEKPHLQSQKYKFVISFKATPNYLYFQVEWSEKVKKMILDSSVADGNCLIWHLGLSRGKGNTENPDSSADSLDVGYYA